MSPQYLFKSVAQSSLAALLSPSRFLSFIQKLIQTDHLQFVTVVYDDFHGIKRPIGLIHLVMLHGEKREILTYCCNGNRQPGMALFVKKRTGNLADQVALSFDHQDIIPAWLKRLPNEYSKEHFQTMCGA